MSRESAPPAIFNPDGSLNEGVLSEQYGLGVEEASQEVTFGSYTGTVAEMLGDERCPVGGMIRSAYKETGIDGVVEKFDFLNKMDRNFTVTVTETTIERETVKKNQIFPQTL